MINYPGQGKKYRPQRVLSNHNNRGMSLEKDLNDSNTFYNETEQALIYKKPTPIQVVRVDYQKRTRAKIIEAYFQKPSTTDYGGVYRGRALDFEAKETSSDYFFLEHIHAHQIAHLRRAHYQGAIIFVIVFFKKYQEVFYLEGLKMLEAYYRMGVRGKLSYQYFQEEAYVVEQSLSPRLKYLKVVDRLYF